MEAGRCLKGRIICDTEVFTGQMGAADALKGVERDIEALQAP